MLFLTVETQHSTQTVKITLYNVCSVHRGDIMSTSGDIMSTSGDIMSTSGDVQYIEGIS